MRWRARKSSTGAPSTKGMPCFSSWLRRAAPMSRIGATTPAALTSGKTAKRRTCGTVVPALTLREPAAGGTTGPFAAAVAAQPQRAAQRTRVSARALFEQLAQQVTDCVLGDVVHGVAAASDQAGPEADPAAGLEHLHADRDHRAGAGARARLAVLLDGPGDHRLGGERLAQVDDVLGGGRGGIAEVRLADAAGDFAGGQHVDGAAGEEQLGEDFAGALPAGGRRGEVLEGQH